MVPPTVETMRDCPLCGGRPDRVTFPFSTTWKERRYWYVRCARCGCTYVDPIPAEADLAEMYSSENYHDVHYADASGEERYRKSAQLLRRLAGARTRLLDFGCGMGAFMIAASQHGFDAVGVEYERSAVESAGRKTGMPVMTFDELRATGRRFEVIHLGDVLEHLPAPLDTMRELEEMLAPGGIFFVDGPLQSNPSLVYYASRAFKALRRTLGLDVPASVAPTHLILATAAAQRRFFTDTLGLRCAHFAVTESGWPYCTEAPTAPTPAVVVRGAIGTGAILLSWVLAGWGNRFTAMLETEPSAR